MARKGLPAFKPPTVQRSRNMRAIRSSANATTERRLVSMFLRARLHGWRLRAKQLPGTPDFVFPQSRVVVFVDGCFFHERHAGLASRLALHRPMLPDG